jgi:prevent-host-death family protein
MEPVNIYDAKAQLSKLVDRALAGEEVIIARAGKALVRLVPVDDQAPRVPGLAKGRVTDAFFEPLPEEELAAWESR